MLAEIVYLVCDQVGLVVRWMVKKNHIEKLQVVVRLKESLTDHCPILVT